MFFKKAVQDVSDVEMKEEAAQLFSKDPETSFNLLSKGGQLKGVHMARRGFYC